MSQILQILNVIVFSPVIQVIQAVAQGLGNAEQLLELLKQVPGIGGGLAVFAVFAMGSAAVAKVTGHLDQILSFGLKYFGRQTIALSDQRLLELRQQLLKIMETDVAQRLEDSLHNLVRVDLAREEQRQQVGRRTTRLAQIHPKRAQPLPQRPPSELSIINAGQDAATLLSAESTYDSFRRKDIGGRLLILGEPGAGKTTELLTVAQRLIAEALDDEMKPIPILFELASWTSGTPIGQWFSQQLTQKYGVSRQVADRLAQQWIEKNQILPLLDGLDELGQQNQTTCIAALETFLAQHRAMPALVCCRREEYEKGGQQLQQLNGALYLQPVSLTQVQQYLRDLDRVELWETISQQPELLELAQSPLFLVMVVVAYQGQAIRDRSDLLEAYVQKQLHDINNQGIYPPEREITPAQTRRYLSWLARQMEQHRETEFLIESLQPAHLATDKQKSLYKLAVGLIGGLCFGLTGQLIGGLVSAISGVVIGGLAAGTNHIKPLEKLTWKPKLGLTGGLIAGLLGGLVFSLISGLIVGLASGLLFGLTGGLVFGLANVPIQRKLQANQGIRKSLHNALTYGLIGGLFSGALFGLIGSWIDGWNSGLELGLFFGLTLALVSSAIGGLIPAIQHLALRIILTRYRNMPWNYEQFLEHATRHRFIQRTGGRYRFIHALLRQHFAQRTSL